MNGSLYLENPNVIRAEIADAENASTDLSAAVVNLTISVDGGAAVPGFAWPIAMAFVTGSTYAFRYKLPESLALVDGTKYIAKIAVTDAASGLVGTFKKRLSASELFV